MAPTRAPRLSTSASSGGDTGTGTVDAGHGQGPPTPVMPVMTWAGHAGDRRSERNRDAVVLAAR